MGQFEQNVNKSLKLNRIKKEKTENLENELNV